MKNNFDRTKTATARFSTRAIAMVLFFVMLLTAIGSGSVLSAIAADLGGSFGASVEAIRTAADEALGIAETAADQAADTAPALDFEENEIVRGMKNDIAGTGANADLAETGWSNCYVAGSWDNWTQHSIYSSSWSVTLPANTTYEFAFKAENSDWFKDGVTISGTNERNYPKSGTSNAKLKTTIAGVYTFQYIQFGNDTVTVKITYPVDDTPDTWTAAGAYGASSSAAAGFFGTAWAADATANDLTNTSGTTWSKTWSNVTLDAQTTVYYKVVKNHSWDNTSYPSSNATKTIPAGTYDITITYNSSTNAVDLTYRSVAKSTLTVADVTNADVTATYNGETAPEGETISNIPQGAEVRVSVTPDSGYKCDAVTGTYNSSSTVAGTMNGNARSWTIVMPGAATSVSATITPVTLKKIYFNNSYTLYGSVYAYVYDKNGNTKTYEYLGAYPGKTMNKLDNSNIWYIEVPSDVDYVQFVSGEGYTTGEMSIPWNSYTYPKYTAPYGYNSAPTPNNGGTWGNYLYGSNNTRTNEYTVSKGTTMNASNLFTGITATLYDYYTDGEITKNAGTATDTTTSSGWIGGIASDEYSSGTNASGWKWDPYTKLNSALSSYANNTAEPKYAVTRPLYFGNLNDKDGGSALVSSYYNFVRNANNSIDLNPNTTAVTGLSGKSLAGSTIHYYKSGVTDENGVPMAMFDEDFLSGENSQKKPLASILRTAAFPVRKTVEGGTISGVNKLYLNPAQWANNDCVFDAYFWGASNSSWVAFPDSGDKRAVDIPSWATSVIFVRRLSSTGHKNTWDPKERQSVDITLSKTGTGAKNVYTFDNNWSNTKSSFNASLDTSLDGCTFTGGHDYYTFNSTGGRDNAYIRNINKSSKTAQIDYYANDAAWSGGTTNNTQGFFPFDYANKGSLAKDLGFGMKLTIPFTLNGNGSSNGINTDGTPQTFDFSGDDDLWVFVDGKLVLDLGGAHARTTGSINFKTKTVTAANQQSIASGITRNSSFASGFNTNENYVHTMTIYYMERGMLESNLQFGFSFHAIPNQFWIDKKIRTKDIINAGFYASNGQTGNASNQDDTLTQREGRFISKFEASYQNESFTVEHKYGSTAAGATTSASGKQYTIDNDTNTYTTPSGGTYPIKHDLGNAFIGQFTTGQYFNLKETFGNNKYVYTPVFSVWDQANNNQAITATGDNTAGYTFHFNPTTTVTTGIENTNIKARFENYMVAHTLTLKKEITNATDTTTPFTIQVMFDFENDGNYIAYPLYCDIDGERTQLDGEGKIAIKAGQILEIEEIPQNAKIQVKEILTDTSTSGYRYGGMTLKEDATTITPTATITKGIQFVMHSDDISVNIANKKPDNKYTIKYTYPSYDNLYGNQSYTVSGVFTEKEMDTYLTYNSETDTTSFTSAELKKTFVNSKAPYEDNFMQTLSFANSTINDTGSGLGWNNGNYSCEVNAAATTDDQVSVSFNLPYAVQASDVTSIDASTFLVPTATSGKVAKIPAQTVGTRDISCFDWYVSSGKSHNNKSGDNPVFVKAPLIIYDGDTPYYFNYWSVQKASGYGMKQTEYTRCYDYEFNLSLFMDTVIVPIYKTTWAQKDNPPTAYDMYGRYDPEKQIAADQSSQSVSIAFLENSRNQYNNNDDGTVTSRGKGAAADVIYSDFLLSFNYAEGYEQLNQRQAGTTKAGLVVEAVDYLEGTNLTTFDTTIEYRNATNIATEETKKEAIQAWAASGLSNTSKPSGMAASEFDVTSLDNKNRIQYYYALNNRKLDTSTGNLLNTLQNRYKVFRAYAYIREVNDSNSSNVIVSDPVYFTIYDMASNGLSNNATGK